ncbi:MAG TPA: pilus assembly protein PilM [Thermosynergistes sp.]|nr:pilus assembly protein PilM [Thermosynergistes sp.]
MSLFKRSRARAGLAIDSDGLRYVEVSKRAQGARCVFVPSSAPLVRQEMLADASGLSKALEALKEKLSSFRLPLFLGVPPRDVMMRVVQLPIMDIEDARSALVYEFDKYFPFAVSDATYDVAPVDVPESASGQMNILVAASRRNVIDNLTKAAVGAGVDLAALEPANLAAFRAVCGPNPSPKGGLLALILGREGTQLVAAYKDNGLLFRTLLAGLESLSSEELVSALAREVTTTMAYVRSTLKGLEAEVLIISGGGREVAGALEEVLGLPVCLVDVWEMWGFEAPRDASKDGWEAAIGLAVRDLS